jgi:hypothetical protein
LLADTNTSSSHGHAGPCLPSKPLGPKKQGAPKKKKKADVGTMVPFLRFFAIFRSDFRKYFYGVFGLLMQRNGQKRDKKVDGKRRQEKDFFSSTFSAKSF